MRFPFRSQTESADCGPACIQMVAAYYGKKMSLSTIKEYCHVSRLGICLKDLIVGCRHIGFHAIPLNLENEKLKEMPLPAILYWKQEHYIVLYRITSCRGETYYHIADPSYGKVKLKESDFIEAWTFDGKKGITVALEPQSAFYSQEDAKDDWKQVCKSLKRILLHLIDYKKKILQIFFLSILTFICGLLIPFLIQKIMDDGIGLKNINIVFILLIGQLMLYLGRQVSMAINNYMLCHIGLNVGLKISTRYIVKLVKLPLGLFDTKLGTDLLQRLSDEQTIRSFLTQTISSFLFVILNFIIYSFVLCYYNIYIFLIFIVFSTFSLGLTRWLLIIRKQRNYAIFAGMGKKRNLENELVYGMAELKINVAHTHLLTQWEKEQLRLNGHSLKSLLYESSITSGTTLLIILRDTLITGGCAWFVIGDEMTIGAMMTITYILGQLSSTFSQIIGYGNTAQDAILAYNRIEEILGIQDENKNRNLVVSNKPSEGIVFNKVSFKYDGTFNPYVLHNVEIVIPLRKVTAIVGASGSGKTTLLKLLLAFYRPQKGDIYIDNINLSQMNVEEWRKKCGVVMQDGYIFSGTIASNIALGENFDIERLRQAAQIACIEDFIEKLPNKYYTKIGKAGMDLSGGQKQRLLIARAVYKNPDFIFFDEATSSLDADNENVIMKNLKEFYKNRTVIIIAHRLSTVKDADNIIVLDKGCVVEQGNHTVLTEKQGLYYYLVKNQLELGQ